MSGAENRVAELLAAELQDLGLDHDVSAVVRRGKALRRRRRAPLLVGAGLLAAAVGIGVSPAGTPPAFAKWTSAPQASDEGTNLAILEGCSNMSDRTGTLERARPVIIDRRGDVAVTVVERAGTYFGCTLFRGVSQQVRWAQGGGGPVDAVGGSSLSPLELVQLGHTTIVPLHADVVEVIGRVEPTITRVTFDTGEMVVTGKIDQGWVTGWWPAEKDNWLSRVWPWHSGPSTAVRVSAYDADGTLVTATTVRAQ